MPIQNKAPTPKRQAPIENDLMAKQLTDARQAPFVWFDPALDDASLTPFEFRLYGRIARITSGGKTQFFEALTKSAKICNMSERAARYAIKGLLKRRMLRCILKLPGEPSTYALTDKTEWIYAPPARIAPLHYVQPSPAPDAAPTAPSAGTPLHEVPINKIKKKQKKKERIERAAATAAVPAAAAAASANGTAAAAKSKFAETLILDYLDDCKPQNKHRNAGLAHKLWLTGSDDHLIERWQQKRATAAAAITAQQQQQEEAASISSSLDLADLLLSKKQLSHQDREWLPDIISLLSTRPDLAGTVDQLKGLL